MKIIAQPVSSMNFSEYGKYYNMSSQQHNVVCSEDIKAIIIHPGDVVVLNEGIWHDACHGIKSVVPYYWFAQVLDTPTEWIEIADGPVEIRVNAH
ncbi:hypothetical protein [Psychrobacillus soli]|uniref:Uncharacterized protein n=1 Tax=Psychrobacillus soli TaxID=1543965 RepID=A0A544TGF4_9BACI|nr:hypothetical protein [Psychrobacillus soli]TQR16497.1 hypothetical protein FG383_06060 [Psychrobacillus soli]